MRPLGKHHGAPTKETHRLQIIGVLDLRGGRAVHARAGARDRYTAVQNAAGWPIDPGNVRTLAEILEKRPGWQIFRDGCPGGESIEEVGARADRVIHRLRTLEGDVLLFSSGREIAAPALLRDHEACRSDAVPPAERSVEALDRGSGGDRRDRLSLGARGTPGYGGGGVGTVRPAQSLTPPTTIRGR